MKELITKEHLEVVPLDHLNPKVGSIHIFARELYYSGNEKADIFVYLQGGPGFSSPTGPGTFLAIKPLLFKYRVLLVDQRGTGKSDKIGPETCQNYKTPVSLAKYLSHFRADQIVFDLEFLREKTFKVKNWFLLAQSYGGFITFSYLSFFSKSIKGALVFGGLPPLTEKNVTKIYDKLTDNILQRNAEYYQNFPNDKSKVKKIVNILYDKPFVLPDGGIFSPDRFLNLGMILGSNGGINALHNLLDDPFLDTDQKRISYIFARTVTDRSNYETNPIYAVLHESIYCDGFSSNWAAEKNLISKKDFSLKAKTIAFLGETIRPSMFTDYAMLKPFQKAAEIIAKKSDWGKLYDLGQLSKNEVPIEAIVYQTDYYVSYDFSIKTRDFVPQVVTYVEKKLQHDSLRSHGPNLVLKALIRLQKRLLS